MELVKIQSTFNRFARFSMAHSAPALFLLFVLFAEVTSLAQLAQPARFEMKKKSSDHDFTVVSMGETGIALIHDLQKYQRGDNLWEIIILDSTLQETWKKELIIENRFNLIGHEYSDETLYFLFRVGETEQGKLKIIKVDFKDGQTEEHNYEPELNIRLTHFNVVANQVVLAGYVSNQPTVLLYNLSNKHAKIIPGLLLNNSELLDVRINVNKTFNVLIAERESKLKKRLISKTFDQAGAMLLDDVIEVDPSKVILSGFTSTLIRDELMIIGTWGEGTLKQAAGVFTVLVDPYTEQKISYFDFAQFNHFLDYLKPKSVTKIKLKSENRRKLGKTPEFKAYVLPARLEETKNGFLFYMEAYYSSANINNNRWNNNPYGNYPYSPYGFNPYRSFNTPFNYGYPNSFGSNNAPDTKMLHGSLAVFNEKGELVADHGFKLDNLKMASPEQVSDFIYAPTKCTLIYSKEKEIRYQVSQLDGVALMDEKVSTQLKTPTESVRSDNGEVSLARFWYGSFFFLFGNQSIRSTEGENREVFYINKLRIE
ncbi:MAG: hypothetical protein ORN54_09970 [Cyclobacteriaceae bacterium]|nr:hypothetical protein [Cyclobacteriaceae bacterium]